MSLALINFKYWWTKVQQQIAIGKGWVWASMLNTTSFERGI